MGCVTRFGGTIEREARPPAKKVTRTTTMQVTEALRSCVPPKDRLPKNRRVRSDEDDRSRTKPSWIEQQSPAAQKCLVLT